MIKTLTIIALAGLITASFTACGEKTPTPSNTAKSSSKNDADMWQHFQSKNAMEGLDKEFK